MKKSLQALLVHLTHIVVITIGILLVTIVFSKAFAQEDETEYDVPDAVDAPLYNVNHAATQKQSNKLWTAYTIWSNRVMLCLADDSPSDISIRRLLKHEDVVDEAMETYYSENMGRKLSELLYSHKAIVAEMRRTAAAGDTAANAAAYHEFLLNKNDVIEFVHEASPIYSVARAEK